VLCFLHGATRHRACVPSSDGLSLWSFVTVALRTSIAPPPAFWFPCCLLCWYCAPLFPSTPLFPFPMKAAETRRHLVRMVLVEGTTVAAESLSLGLSVRSASRYVGYFRGTGGELHDTLYRSNRHADNVCDYPWLSAADLTAVDEQPELFLDETTDAVNYLMEEVGPGVKVSAVTVGRILSRNGLTHKVIERAFLTRNEEQRALSEEEQERIPLRCRVSVDKANRVGCSAGCRWAWSLRGARAECYVEASPGVRTSFFVAMAHDHVLDWMVTRPPPGQTAADYLVYVTKLFLPRMCSPEEGLAREDQIDRCVLVLDNAVFKMRFLLRCCGTVGCLFFSCLRTLMTSIP